MYSRGFMMQSSTSSIVPSNTYLPFNSIEADWTSFGPSHHITYSDVTNTFFIPVASDNDYYFSWQVTLKTLSSSQEPIAGLVFTYNQRIRTDYMVFPAKTLQLKGFSIYHIETPSLDDLLEVGLKLVGEEGSEYKLCACSHYMISAKITIMAL